MVHYGSASCKRVTRSVLAADVHALVMVLDACYVIRKIMAEITWKNSNIESFVDSKTLFDLVAKDGGTHVRRMKIDIFSLN